MAEASEGVAPPGNAEDKSKTEFLNRVKKVKSEIKTKFQKVRKELDDQELNILKRVEDIEQEILENYELTAISLKEINQAKEHALATFKSNTTSSLLKENLEMYNKEIKKIKHNSKIDSTIGLVWKMEKFDLSSNICEVSSINMEAPRRNTEDSTVQPQPEYENTFERIDNLAIYQQNPPEFPNPTYENYPPAQMYQPRIPYQPRLPNPLIPYYSSNPNFGNDQPYRVQSNSGNANYLSRPLHKPMAKIEDVNPRKQSQYSENSPMNDLLKLFFSVKNEGSLVPSRETDFPEELHEMAKDMIKINQQEYKILQIYDIIILNLEKEKPIEDIMTGFYNLTKYPLCLFLDLDRPEFHQIRTFSGYYTYEIKEKLAGFEPIMEAFGYKLEGPMYKLDPEKKNDPNFIKELAIINCELLLAYEELSSFNELRKMAPNTEPKAHFITQKQMKDFRNHNEIPNPYPPVQKGANVPTNLSSNSHTGQPPFSPNPGYPSGTRGAEPRGVDPYHDQYQYPNNNDNPPYNNPYPPSYPGAIS